MGKAVKTLIKPVNRVVDVIKAGASGDLGEFANAGAASIVGKGTVRKAKGLLKGGGGGEAVAEETPEVVDDTPESRELTSETADAIANARERANRLQQNRGRKSLRIDLATPSTGSTTRSGLTLN